MELVQMELVQMVEVQMRVIQLGVVQLGLVQKGADCPAETAVTGVLRIHNTQTEINVKKIVLHLSCNVI